MLGPADRGASVPHGAQAAQQPSVRSCSTSRPRVYIVGLSHMQRNFNWPAAHEPVGLRSVLEASPHPSDGPANATELYNLRASLQSLRQNGFTRCPEAVVDLAVGWQAGPSITYGHCPCLLKGHAASNSYWLLHLNRRFTLAEYFQLQGFPAARAQRPETVSVRQMRGMIGNAYTVTTVSAIFDRMLFSAGWTQAPIKFGRDPGEQGVQI